MRALFWIVIIGSYIVAMVPQEMAPVIGSFGDKTHHILAFIIIGFLLRLTYKINYCYAFFFLFSYGLFIEFSQFFSINRSAEWKDVVADLLGSLIGLQLYEYLRKVI